MEIHITNHMTAYTRTHWVGCASVLPHGVHSDGQAVGFAPHVLLRHLALTLLQPQSTVCTFVNRSGGKGIHSKSWDTWDPDPADNLNFLQKDCLRTRKCIRIFVNFYAFLCIYMHFFAFFMRFFAFLSFFLYIFYICMHFCAFVVAFTHF